MSLAEYQSQLSDIELLLADAPEDESLLKLKSDLVELIELTAAEEHEADNVDVGGGSLHSAHDAKGSDHDHDHERDVANIPESNGKTSQSTGSGDAKAAAKLEKKMKKKANKEFEIPEHLLPLESDTEAQRNKKRRTIKSLKSKHKAARKEYESNQKQASWLDFSKKTRKKGKHKSSSIFKTSEHGDVKVGVVTTGNVDNGNKSTSTSNKRQRHVF
jgi:survival-of-motor-neuron-related-splicing factor 30